MTCGDLRLTKIEVLGNCKISKPFTFVCQLTNTSTRSMELDLRFNIKRNEHNYAGSSEQNLGIVEAEKSKQFKLTIFPSRLGIINVNNLQLVDNFSKKIYEFNDLLQLLVYNSTENISTPLFKFQDH